MLRPDLVALDAEDLTFTSNPDSRAGGLVVRVRTPELHHRSPHCGALEHPQPHLPRPRRLRPSAKPIRGPLFPAIDRDRHTYGRLAPTAVDTFCGDEDPTGYPRTLPRAGFVNEARRNRVPDPPTDLFADPPSQG